MLKVLFLYLNYKAFYYYFFNYFCFCLFIIFFFFHLERKMVNSNIPNLITLKVENTEESFFFFLFYIKKLYIYTNHHSKISFSIQNLQAHSVPLNQFLLLNQWFCYSFIYTTFICFSIGQQNLIWPVIICLISVWFLLHFHLKMKKNHLHVCIYYLYIHT